MNDKEKQEYLIQFGKHIKYLRTAKGWTQEELAEKCGYTSSTKKTTIQKIEAGKSDLSASKIATVAAVFGVRPSELIDPPTQIKQEITICDLFESCYGKESYTMVQAFLKLDQNDRLIIYGRILGMLDAEKYQTIKTSKKGTNITA